MNREDTVWLLKQIMAACPSFCRASAVSIAEEGNGWLLSAYWVPGALDEDCLEKIVTEYGLEIVTSKGRTVFRSTKNSTNQRFESAPIFLAITIFDVEQAVEYRFQDTSITEFRI